MSDDYLWDRSGAPDPDVKQLEDLLVPLRHAAPLEDVGLRRRRRGRKPWLAGAIVLAAAAAVVLVVVRLRPVRDGGELASCNGFAFSTRGGGSGVLCVGASLDTGERETELAIAQIGRAELGPNTRIALDRSGPGAHHLTIDHGHMHARVNAPPRLFQVSTRSTEVTDLGCEYTIDVDDAGAGAICVQTGQVELATPSGAIVVAAAGTCAQIAAGRSAGLPIARDAPPELASAAREPRDVAAVLAHARPADAITLANLATLDAAHRRDILVRLAELSPPPARLTIDDALDPAMLRLWLDDIVLRRRLELESGRSGKSSKSSKSAPGKLAPSKSAPGQSTRDPLPHDDSQKSP